MRIYGKNWTIKIGLCVLSFVGCHSAGDQGSPTLRHTYDSMEKVYGDGPWPDRLETDYSEFQKKAAANPGRHTDWADMADSMYKKAKAFAARVEKVRVMLKDADPGGKDTRLAEKMLTHTRLGDSLRNELSTTLSACRPSQSPVSPAAFDLVHGDTRQCTDRRYWNDEAFAGKSTSEAEIRLMEFGSTCEVEAQLTLENMIKQF